MIATDWPPLTPHHLLEQEIRPYLSMSPKEKWEQVRLACRGAAHQLSFRQDRRRVLDWVDPLPQSSRDALARLRAQARKPK